MGSIHSRWVCLAHVDSLISDVSTETRYDVVFFATPIVAHFIATAVVVWHLRQAARQKSIGRILVTDGILYLVAVEIVGLLQLCVHSE